MKAHRSWLSVSTVQGNDDDDVVDVADWRLEGSARTLMEGLLPCPFAFLFLVASNVKRERRTCQKVASLGERKSATADAKRRS